MSIFIIQCKKAPQTPVADGGTPDAAAPASVRTDASLASPLPARSQTVAASPSALAIVWPAVLPCKEFDHFFFPYVPDGADTVEWLSPAPAASFQFQVAYGGILASERKRLPLSRIVAARPGWLRFLHNPEAARLPFKFGLNCADSGFVHWDCDQGTCRPAVGFRPRPDQKASGFLATRYRLRWNCERQCQSKGKLAGLVSQPLQVLRGRRASELLALARDVAADVHELIQKACTDHGCSGSVDEYSKILARFRQEPLSGPFVDETLSAERDGDRKYGFLDLAQKDAAKQPERATLTSDVRIADQLLRIRCWLDDFIPPDNPACEVELRRGQNVLFSTYLSILTGDEGWVHTDPPGSIGIHRAVAWSAEEALLVIRGGALRTIGEPVASLPPLPALAPPELRPMRTVWPKEVRCKRFDSLHGSVSDQLIYSLPDRDYIPTAASQDDKPVDAAAQRADRKKSEQEALERSVRHDGVTGFVWRGGGGAQRFALGQVQLPADFSPAKLLEIEPIVDPAKYRGPRYRIGLNVKLHCADPEGSDVQFDCGHGVCQTMQARNFLQPAPVGKRFLGPGGWQCYGRCAKQKSFAALLTASPASLQGERRALLAQLVQDFLVELQAVIETGCGNDCQTQPRAVLQAARRLQSDADASRIEVAPRQKHAWDPENIRGWSASLVSGKLRFEVACTREITSLGMGQKDVEDACQGTLYEGPRKLAEYHPLVVEGEARHGMEDLESFRQTVYLDGESVSIETGYDYPPRSRSFPPDYFERGRVKGRIWLTTAAN